MPRPLPRQDVPHTVTTPPAGPPGPLSGAAPLVLGPGCYPGVLPARPGLGLLWGGEVSQGAGRGVWGSLGQVAVLTPVLRVFQVRQVCRGSALLQL